MRRDTCPAGALTRGSCVWTRTARKTAAWSRVGGGGGACDGESAGEDTVPPRPGTSASASGGTRPSGRQRPCPQRTACPPGGRSCTSCPCDASDRMWSLPPAPPSPLSPARWDWSCCRSPGSSGSASCSSRCSCRHSSCGSHSWVESLKLLASSQTWLLLPAPDPGKPPQCDGKIDTDLCIF